MTIHLDLNTLSSYFHCHDIVINFVVSFFLLNYLFGINSQETDYYARSYATFIVGNMYYFPKGDNSIYSPISSV